MKMEVSSKIMVVHDHFSRFHQCSLVNDTVKSKYVRKKRINVLHFFFKDSLESNASRVCQQRGKLRIIWALNTTVMYGIKMLSKEPNVNIIFLLFNAFESYSCFIWTTSEVFGYVKREPMFAKLLCTLERKQCSFHGVTCYGKKK